MTVRRVDILAIDVFKTLLAKLQKVVFLSLDVDKYTDNLDTAQYFCVFSCW